jgi:sporulation protein YabP
MEEKAAAGGSRQHKLILQNRSSGSINGICDVVSFDESVVVLDTEMGLLTIKGRELHVSRLTLEKGEIDIEGNIDSLTYSSNEALHKSGKSLFTRLFQ